MIIVVLENGLEKIQGIFVLLAVLLDNFERVDAFVNQYSQGSHLLKYDQSDIRFLILNLLPLLRQKGIKLDFKIGAATPPPPSHRLNFTVFPRRIACLIIVTFTI